MRFEEKFPELKYSGINIQLTIEDSKRLLLKKRPTVLIPAEHVERHCLSKQRVKEAIEIAFDVNQLSGVSVRRNILLKELGLEDQP